MSKRIIKALAKELAKRDMKSLEEFVCGMKFKDAYRLLNGFNLDSWGDEEGEISGSSFDVNYKSITTTIFDDDGNCFLYDICDVWLPEYSSPIERIVLD